MNVERLKTDVCKMELDKSLHQTILRAAGAYFTRTLFFTQSIKLTTSLSIIVDEGKQLHYVAYDTINRGDSWFYGEDAKPIKQPEKDVTETGSQSQKILNARKTEPCVTTDTANHDADASKSKPYDDKAQGSDTDTLDDEDIDLSAGKTTTIKEKGKKESACPCPICLELFISGEKLTEHLLKRHDDCVDSEFKCKVCTEACLNVEGFIQHCLDEHHDLGVKKGFKVSVKKACVKKSLKRKGRPGKVKAKVLPKRSRKSKKAVVMEYDESDDGFNEDEGDSTVDFENMAGIKSELTGITNSAIQETVQDLINNKNADNTSSSILCTICGKKYMSQKALRRHNIVKHENKTHPCEICFKEFNSKESLYHHKRGIHTDVKAYQCDEPGCKASFNFNHSLKLHKLKHTGTRPYTCSTCGKTYLTAHHLKVHHMGVHGGEKLYTCKTCGKSFSYMTSLRMHETSHLTKTRVACNQCDKTFVNTQALKYHTMTKHMEKGSYKCEECGKVYSTEMVLKSHMRRHTKDNNRFMCDICGRQFMYKSALEMHKSVHRDDKTYTCQTCQKSFKTYATLYSHMIVHKEGTPFNCKECGKAFKTKERMKAHFKRHSGLKPFDCTVCGHCFPDKGGLSKHMKTVHCLVKKFVCDICGKSTTRADNLRVHMKVHVKEPTKPSVTVEPSNIIFDDDLPSNVPLVIATDDLPPFPPIKKQRKPRTTNKSHGSPRVSMANTSINPVTHHPTYQSNMPHFSTIDPSQIAIPTLPEPVNLQHSTTGSPANSIPSHIANENMVIVETENSMKEEPMQTVAQVPSTVTAATISVTSMQPVNYMYPWQYIYAPGTQQPAPPHGFYQQ